MCEHQLSLLPYGSQISNSCLQGWQSGPLPSELTCQSETILVGPRYGKDLPFSSCFLLSIFSNHNNSASLETLQLGDGERGRGYRRLSVFSTSPAESKALGHAVFLALFTTVSSPPGLCDIFPFTEASGS